MATRWLIRFACTHVLLLWTTELAFAAFTAEEKAQLAACWRASEEQIYKKDPYLKGANRQETFERFESNRQWLLSHVEQFESYAEGSALPDAERNSGVVTRGQQMQYLCGTLLPDQMESEGFGYFYLMARNYEGERKASEDAFHNRNLHLGGLIVFGGLVLSIFLFYLTKLKLSGPSAFMIMWALGIAIGLFGFLTIIFIPIEAFILAADSRR